MSISEFSEDPTDFLKKNIVLSRIGSVKTDGNGIIEVSLVHKSNFCGKDMNGKAMKVFDLLPHVALNDDNIPKLKVYWCKFSYGKTHSVTLGAGAQFMFTTNMDGCTFGVGARADDGAVTVCHANSAGKADIARENQINSVQEALNDVSETIRPSIYRDEITRSWCCRKKITPIRSATTIGQRIDGRWVFYAQVYKTVPPNYIFCEIQESVAYI